MIKLGFIGAGTVGTALAVRLHRKGYPVVAVSSRSRSSAGRFVGMVPGCQVAGQNQGAAEAAELVFITTPDDVIDQVVSSIKWHSGQSVVHCSGALSTDVLATAEAQGAKTGAFHPLQTFAGIKQAIDNLPGSTFALEAREPLLGTLKEMTAALEGSFIELGPGDKVLYHAAAVMACNYMVTLVKLATDLWQTFNVPGEQATQALMPLLRGTLHNIDTVGIPQCLTGPIARGDIGTIKKHLAALEKGAPSLVATYRELGLKTIPIALAKGRISQNQAEALEATFKEGEGTGSSETVSPNPGV
ncbi:MAG: DUF2520 domain-containing protein [Chloroflexota bacterium]